MSSDVMPAGLDSALMQVFKAPADVLPLRKLVLDGSKETVKECLPHPVLELDHDPPFRDDDPGPPTDTDSGLCELELAKPVLHEGLHLGNRAQDEDEHDKESKCIADIDEDTHCAR